MGNESTNQKKPKIENKEEKTEVKENKNLNNEKNDEYKRSFSMCEPVNINAFNANNNKNNIDININDNNNIDKNNQNNNDINNNNDFNPFKKINEIIKEKESDEMKNREEKKEKKLDEINKIHDIRHCDTSQKLLGGNKIEKKEKKVIKNDLEPMRKNDLKSEKNIRRNYNKIFKENKDEDKKEEEKKIDINDELLNSKENNSKKISRNLNENYMTENNNNNFMQTDRNFFPSKRRKNIDINEKENKDNPIKKQEKDSSNLIDNNKLNSNKKKPSLKKKFSPNQINKRRYEKKIKSNKNVNIKKSNIIENKNFINNLNHIVNKGQKIIKDNIKIDNNITSNDNKNNNESKNIINYNDNIIKNDNINLNKIDLKEDDENQKMDFDDKKEKIIINNNNIINNNQININNNIILDDKIENNQINEIKLNDDIKINEEDEAIIFAQNLNIGNIIEEKNIPIPNYFFMLENINIFNSILIILNNNSFINEYFLKDKITTIINGCENNNQYCLSSILYHMNKYLWNYKEKYISEENLKVKYFDFINCYISTNCNNSSPDYYCYNLENLQLIINFIYDKLNKELTSEYLRGKQSFNNNMSIANSLSSFFYTFQANNKSKISDFFMGIYENQKICSNCQNKNRRFGFAFNNNYNYNNNGIEYFYDSFSLINFDLKEVVNDMNKNRDMYNNSMVFSSNFIQNINLGNCFDYEFYKKQKKYYQYCNKCYFKTLFYEIKKICLLPTIITIILSNNDDNFFIIYDEINLKNYEEKNVDDGLYYIVSILCQMTYNGKFICYCISPNNGCWYAYSEEGINEVERMDINAKPLVLFYQKKSSVLKRFNYKIILRDDLNKVQLNINFINGMRPMKLFFNKNTLIKDVIEQILLYTNLKGKGAKLTLIINGIHSRNEQKLSQILENNQNKAKVTVNIV